MPFFVIAFAIFATTLSQTSHAQLATPQPIKAPIEVQAGAKLDLLQEAKLQVLQTEVQVLKDFTQHILSTVYFTLGTVVLVLFSMVGFSWYQNIRVLERDKEAMRKSLENLVEEQFRSKSDEFEREFSTRIAKVDETFGTALGTTIKRVADLELNFRASLFQSTHSGKTPMTDFVVFLQAIQQSIGRVSFRSLEHSLSVVVSHLESTGGPGTLSRTEVHSLVNSLPPECAALASRIREFLQK